MAQILLGSLGMSRPARHMILAESSATIHFMWRCHNRDFLLRHDETKKLYLKLLAETKAKYGIKIYAYAIMNNHFHAVLKLPSRTNWQNFSRSVNSRLAMFINKKFGRSGQVIMDRPKTIVIENDAHLLNVLRYVELNPLRAGLVKKLKNYLWSSFRHHAFGEDDNVLDPCPVLERMGHNKIERQQNYRRLFEFKFVKSLIIFRSDLVDAYFIGSAQWIVEKTLFLRKLKRRGMNPAPG